MTVTFVAPRRAGAVSRLDVSARVSAVASGVARHLRSASVARYDLEDLPVVAVGQVEFAARILSEGGDREAAAGREVGRVVEEILGLPAGDALEAPDEVRAPVGIEVAAAEIGHGAAPIDEA